MMFDKKHSVVDYKEKVELEYKKLTLVANSWNLNKKKYENIYKKTVSDLEIEENNFKNKLDKYSIFADNNYSILKYNETCMHIYNKFYNYIKHFTEQKYIDIFVDKVNAEDRLIKQQILHEQERQEAAIKHQELIGQANILGGLIMNGGCIFMKK
jgi:hypothetical protein